MFDCSLKVSSISLATKMLTKLDLYVYIYIYIYIYFFQKRVQIEETLMKETCAFLIKDDELLIKLKI